MKSDTISNIFVAQVASLLKRCHAANKFTDLTIETAMQDASFLVFFSKIKIYDSLKPLDMKAPAAPTSTKGKSLQQHVASGRGRKQADRIFDYLKQFPNKSREQIADALQIRLSSVCGAMGKLIEDGKVFESGTTLSSADVQVGTYSAYGR